MTQEDMVDFIYELIVVKNDGFVVSSLIVNNAINFTTQENEMFEITIKKLAKLSTYKG
ncbi:MAG: hypothetical protein RR107_05395 [Clostridia bacterium]